MSWSAEGIVLVTLQILVLIGLVYVMIRGH